MKKYAIILLSLLTLGSALSPVSAAERKKVGVVLSGGGAKGMAHVGALKVIEEAGIPIDYIVGTSMGAIVGGLYAIGYTTTQLDSMVQKQDWSILLSDKTERQKMNLIQRENAEKYVISIPITKDKQSMDGLVQGENLSVLFSDLTIGYHDSIDFNHLQVPFACVAMDVVSGEEIVFHNGVIASAIRSSMAIPGVFSPVRKDGMVLVDGGLKNNFPVDVAKDMGADIIIGISVQQDLLEADGLNTVADVLSQVVDHACRAKFVENIEQSDVFVKIDTQGYTSASFTAEAIDTLIQRGEAAMRLQKDELTALREKIGIDEHFTPKPHGPYTSLSSKSIIPIRKIQYPESTEQEMKWVMRKCGLRSGKENNMQQIVDALHIMRDNLGYSEVRYTMEETPDGYDLRFHLNRKDQAKINVGIRFDSEEVAALQVNVEARLKTKVPSSLAITGRLGKRYMARLDYTLEPSLMRHFDFSYQYRYNDIDTYDEGNKVYNVTYNQHTLEAAYSNVWFSNFRYNIGLDFEYYKYKDLLSSGGHEIPDLPSEHFLNYFVQLQYNSLDEGYFPTKGTSLEAGYTVYTDNMAQYNDHSPFSAVNFSWRSVFSIGDRLALIPAFYGRILFGKGVAYAYQNSIGGYYFERYIPRQMPFAGVNNTEFLEKNLLIGGLRARYQIVGQHYAMLSGNIALTDHTFHDILDGTLIYGFSLGYAYNSKFGPLEASVGYSNHTDKVHCYANLGFYF